MGFLVGDIGEAIPAIFYGMKIENQNGNDTKVKLVAKKFLFRLRQLLKERGCCISE